MWRNETHWVRRRRSWYVAQQVVWDMPHAQSVGCFPFLVILHVSGRQFFWKNDIWHLLMMDHQPAVGVSDCAFCAPTMAVWNEEDESKAKADTKSTF